MNLTEVTAPTPLCFSYIAELKIGNMIMAWDFIRLSVFPWWQRNNLAASIPVPDHDIRDIVISSGKKLHQEQQEMIGRLSTKSFEMSLGRAGEWVVSVRLGAAGDRMQSVFCRESRHAPFFPGFFPSIRQSQGIFFLIWILNLMSKRLLWFWCQTILSTNDTLTISPFFLLPHNTPNISWDISFLLVSL